jgi:hypothetical protein
MFVCSFFDQVTIHTTQDCGDPIEHTCEPMESLHMVHMTLNPLHKCLCMFHVCHKS